MPPINAAEPRDVLTRSERQACRSPSSCLFSVTSPLLPQLPGEAIRVLPLRNSSLPASELVSVFVPASLTHSPRPCSIATVKGKTPVPMCRVCESEGAVAGVWSGSTCAWDCWPLPAGAPEPRRAVLCHARLHPAPLHLGPQPCGSGCGYGALQEHLLLLRFPSAQNALP